MIYEPPVLTALDERVIGMIEELRDELRYHTASPRRWLGSLRRVITARSIGGSNSIEGYRASVEDVAAIIAEEKPYEADEETTAAIAGYRQAMTFALQKISVKMDISTLLAMHFMMMSYDMDKNPGQWRPGAVWVVDDDGETTYEAPDRGDVESLVDETLAQIESANDPTMIRAAMAHLNLALIHPFSDGNGRMARCLQTYVLASDGVLAPEFSSIEEYLGRHSEAYYRVLEETAGGKWSPGQDTRSWVQFCLTAHFRQARLLKRRIDDTYALWDFCEQKIAAYGLPPQCVGPLHDAARGWKLTRPLFVKLIDTCHGKKIAPQTATRDLGLMVRAGLLEPVGEKRWRRYEPTSEARAIWSQVKEMRKPVWRIDPYEEARKPYTTAR